MKKAFLLFMFFISVARALSAALKVKSLSSRGNKFSRLLSSIFISEREELASSGAAVCSGGNTSNAAEKVAKA